ncbi:hypothetical protein LOCC1_G007942 [Lachnellula occidentalis]|uniref:BTB domain-containing protein n=1 Tax=Lachnellula occidentalis TaxID=215460 RepID=A0A8H8RQ53_9HELO|nr:hypothetical protein LOCC1_G007942 [Lachnellula occidentalis]
MARQKQTSKPPQLSQASATSPASQPPQLTSANVAASATQSARVFSPSTQAVTPAIPRTPLGRTVFESPAQSKVLTPEVLGNEIVKLFVGNKRKEFTVHKKLLCDRADYFSKAFNGIFQEAQRGEMYLPEDDPDTVALLVDFLYRGTVPKAKLIAGGARPLEKLYYLADKLCLPELMDRSADELRSFGTISPFINSDDEINRKWTETHNGSKVRLLCVAEVAFRMRHYSGNPEKGDLYMTLCDTCPDFFCDLFKFQTKYGNRLEETRHLSTWKAKLDSLDPCVFHCHEENAPCYLKGFV